VWHVGAPMKLQVSLHGVLNVLVKRVVFLALVKFLSRLMGLVERFGGVQPNAMTGSKSPPPLFECRIESSSVMASHVSDEDALETTKNWKHVKRRCLLVYWSDFSYRDCCVCFVRGIALVLSKAFGKTASWCFPSRHMYRVWSRVRNTRFLKERQESFSENFKNRP